MNHKRLKQYALKIGWIEFLYAYLMGAPVKTRSGKVYQRKNIKQIYQRILTHLLWGIDISKWQGVVDFVKVKAMGIKFLILRASYGINRDEMFLSYIVSAISIFIGWLFGVYHYYDPRYSPQQQASILLQTINPYKKYIRRVWIDLEFTWTGSYEASSNWKAFAELILANGYEIGFYTRQTWWDSRVGTLSAWFSQFPLWAAQYANALTLIPKSWAKASLWQDKIAILGGPGTAFPDSYEIDHDISDDEFYQAEFGGGVVPPTPPNGGDMYKLEVLASALNGRGTPGGTIKYSAGFRLGDILESSEKIFYDGADWYNITKQTRGTTVITMPQTPIWASAGATYQYLKIITDPVPPPLPPATSDKIASIFKSEEIVVTYADGTKDTFRINNVEFTKVV